MKPTNAKYIKEIIEKTNNLNYLEIKGSSLEEKQAHFQLLIQEKLYKYLYPSKKNTKIPQKFRF